VQIDQTKPAAEPLPVYQPSLRENLASFWEGLTLCFSRKTVLIAGPYAGEFGHEIMDFQGYVRRFKRKFPIIHVLTYPGREALYRGCIVHSHDYDLKSAGYFYGKASNGELRDRARQFAHAQGIKDYALFGPMHLRTRWHRRLLFQQHHEMLTPLAPVSPSQKILFHFRNIQKIGPDNSRNLRPELAGSLCELCQKNGLTVACIGHPDYALCPSGCEDLRAQELEKTLSALASSRLVVGELSGPMHLAIYAAKPVVVWAPGKHRIEYALKRNPFKVAISVVRDDTTNPAPQEILCKIRDALSNRTRP
jgi:hypothetical protein